MPSVETVLGILRSTERRYALYHLDKQESAVSVEELATEVAKMQQRSPDMTPSDDAIHRYKVRLQHAELPKADETSFINYDSDEGTVQLTDQPPEFEKLLSVAEEIENPQHR
jgi:hypothetical protein